MHVYPGLNYYNTRVEGKSPIQAFWHTNYTSRFLTWAETYRSQLSVLFGAHIHRGAIKAPISEKHPNFDMTVLATPAITPFYTNNPGYTLVKYSVEKGQKSKVT
jgi:hypothetical protein